MPQRYEIKLNIAIIFTLNSTWQAVSDTYSPLLSNQPSPMLVYPFILFHQYQERFKPFHSLRLHPPRIHHLPVCLQPVQHVMLLNPVLRRIPMIGLHEAHHLLIPRSPPFILSHIIFLNHQLIIHIQTTKKSPFYPLIPIAIYIRLQHLKVESSYHSLSLHPNTLSITNKRPYPYWLLLNQQFHDRLVYIFHQTSSFLPRLLPHCGTNKYEQNCQMAFKILFISRPLVFLVSATP